jgi:hypothetical protein
LETLLALILGLCLSAASGFRVFVPILGLSIAALTGYVTLSPELAWIGTPPALIAFSTATVLEIGAYYIPWVDNLLDTIATPAAFIAGTLIMASVAVDLSPFLQWSLALIAGGGSASLFQLATAAIRAGSTAATGGLPNPVFSTLELGGSLIVTILAIALPVAGLIVLIGIGYFVITRARRTSRRAASKHQDSR